MKWEEVRNIYPDQYVKVKILSFHIEGNMKYVDDVALIRAIQDPKEATKELLHAVEGVVVSHTCNDQLKIELRHHRTELMRQREEDWNERSEAAADIHDFESDPELKQSILRAKRDITEGRLHSTQEILDAIDNGEEMRTLSELTDEQKDALGKAVFLNSKVLKRLEEAESATEEDEISNYDEYVKYKNER